MSALDGFYSTWNKARETFGQGTPDDGSQFDGSSRLMEMKASVDAAAPDDRWQGSGSQAYAAANKEHASVYEKLAELDKKMAGEVKKAADVVNVGRTNLDTSKGWVESMVNSLPATSDQDRENKLVRIAKAGITQVDNIVKSATDDMTTIKGNVDKLTGEYQTVKDTMRFGPDGENPDELRDGETEDKAKQAAEDLAAAQAGTATPEQLTRLKEAASLTPEQKAALAQGNPTVIPQEQYDYLESLMKEMGSSDVNEAVEHYSGLKYTFGNALAIMGNPDIQTAGGDHGGMGVLPPELQKTFSDPLLRVEPEVFKQLALSGDRGFDPRVLFTHWDDYQNWSNLMGNADPSLMHGNEANTALMTKMGETLDLMHSTGPWSAEANAMSEGMTDQIQNVLNTVGHDQAAVHHVVTSDKGESFIEDFVTHPWTDDGKALGGLLPETSDHSQLAGETMHAFDKYIGENAHASLMDMPGMEKQSLGQVNPEFVKALAQANTPYIDDMLGNNIDDTKGFGPLEPLSNKEMPVTRDLFAVINGNQEAAGILNSQAYLTELKYQSNFEQSIIDGKVINAGDLMSAGTLRGVIDSAASAADNDAIEYGNFEDFKAYESRGAWFDAATKIGAEIPGVKAFLDGVGRVPGISLQDIFVGAAPTPEEPGHVAATSSSGLQYSMAQHLLNSNVGDVSPFRELNLVDPKTGQLVPLTDDRLSDFNSAFNTYFSHIDPAVQSAITSYEGNVRDALPKAEGHTGK